MSEQLDLISRGLGATDAELGLPFETVYRVYIRDAQNRRVAELTEWTALDFVGVFNGVGTWSLETSADNREAQLLAKSGGIIVTLTIEGAERTIFSGFVWTEWGYTGTAFRAAGYCDNALLWLPMRPTPSFPSPPFAHQYDVRTLQASTLMIQYVDINCGISGPDAWRIPGISFAADPLLGSVITGRAAFQPLLTLLQELALTPYAGGLGFKLQQSDTVANSVEFSVYAPPDRSAEAKFSLDLGTAQDYEDIQSAPEANHVFVLGSGFGPNRLVIEEMDPASISEWGRRISTIIDQRDVDDPSELNQKAAEAIAGAVTRKRAAITPFETSSLQYGVHYELGTLIALVTPSGETVDLIRRVEISLDPESGPTVTPVVGEGDGSDDEQMATMVRTIQGRITNLERNWNIPPDSIDRSMLVSVVKPPIGKVEWLAGSTVPEGYLAANGQAINRTTYAGLFDEIGTSWGAGNGSTTFNVPDLRNRSPIGSGSTYSLGQLVGAATASIADHAHTGAPHTHPGSHSHGAGGIAISHVHSGAAHTHPGSHSHGIGSHVHAFDHSHDVDIAPFNSGGESTFAATFSTYPGAVTNVSHNHSINPPNTTTTSPDHLNTGGGSGSTDPDSNAPAATYSGSSGTPTSVSNSGSTDPDSNAPAATYSGSSGLAGATSVSIIHPSAGLTPVIYAGV